MAYGASMRSTKPALESMDVSSALAMSPPSKPTNNGAMVVAAEVMEAEALLELEVA